MSALPDGLGENPASRHDGACPRREFLKSAAAAGTVAVLAAGGASSAPAAAAEEPKLPQIQLGPHRISRLICGSNCFNAGSHLSVFVNRAMREYYTPEQILKTLRRCEEVGINCWQSGLGNLDLYRRHRDEGGRMHFIAIGRRTRGRPPAGRGRLHRRRPSRRNDRPVVQVGPARRDARVSEARARRGPGRRRLDPHARRGRRRRVERLGRRLLHDLRLRAAPQPRGAGGTAGPGADPGPRGLPAERPAAHVRRDAKTKRPAWRSRSWPPAGFRTGSSGSSRPTATRSPRSSRSTARSSASTTATATSRPKAPSTSAASAGWHRRFCGADADFRFDPCRKIVGVAKQQEASSHSRHESSCCCAAPTIFRKRLHDGRSCSGKSSGPPTLVPLKIYFKRGIAKVLMGVCQGLKQHDKREKMRKAEADRAIQRQMMRRR
jgi:hypothetical protein